MSGGLGLALLQGVTGYMKGRTQRREQDDAAALDASRYADTQRRQAAQDARQTMMQDAQLKAMQEQSARQAAMDAKGLREDGYTTTQATQQQGANLAQAYGGPNPLMDAATKALGVGLQAKAKTPDLTLGGTGYVKTRDSDAALARQAEQKYATDLAGINYQRSRDDHVADTRDAQKFTREQQDRSFGQQRALQDNSIEAQQARASAGKVTQPSESERRGAALLTMAQSSNDIMSTMGNPAWTDRAANAVPLVGDAMMSQNGRQFRQAATSFARSYLYLVSGANATQQEADALADQIVPSMLDSKQTMESKATRRADMLQAMHQVAGRASPGAAGAPQPIAAGGDDIKAQAVQAIQQGADPQKVIARYQQATGKKWEP